MVAEGQSLKLQCYRFTEEHIFAGVPSANLVAVEIGTFDGEAG